jgi:hypothetical protein
VTVYKYLFQEGVLWAKKDYNAPKHPDIESVPNLQVIKLMQSFKSRELVTERYAWCHYYWCVPVPYHTFSPSRMAQPDTQCPRCTALCRRRCRSGRSAALCDLLVHTQPLQRHSSPPYV